MRLHLAPAGNASAEVLAGVTWTPGNELWACSEDQAVWRWPTDSEAPTKVCSLDAGGTALHWYPTASRKLQTGAATDVFVLGADDGTFRFMRANGREEKRVDAHTGPITALRWNHEGTGVASGGQDGRLKVWSRSGLLRSVLAQTDTPVYCLAWSPDGGALVYPSAGLLVVAPLAAGARPLQWRAHEGPILALDWSQASGRIASGGEDARYKVWDAAGRLLHQSAPLPSACSAVAWAPGGLHLAVATRGAVLLGSSSGVLVSHSFAHAGVVRSLSWSADGARVAGVGSGGLAVVGQVVAQCVEWGGHSVLLETPTRMTVQEVGSTAHEELEVRERVVCLSFAYDHLLVATGSQVYVYSVASWNTPAVVEVKDTPLLLLQAPTLFLIADPTTGVQLLSYQGRTLATPKWQGLRAESLTAANCSLSSDCLAVIDPLDPRCVRCMGTDSGQPLGEPLRHSHEVVRVALSQGTAKGERRRLALIDGNADVYCTAIQAPALGRLGSGIESLVWHARSDVLVGVGGGRLLLWADPGVLTADAPLLEATKSSVDVSHAGVGVELVSFSGPSPMLRTARGALLHCPIAPYPLLLAQAAMEGRWDAATRLCRCCYDDQLWTALATRAVAAQEIATAETAYAALGQVAMVAEFAAIRAMPREEARAAALAALRRRPDDAEAILVQAGLLYRAIKMHVRAKKWDRALEVAMKHKTHVDTVMWYRQAELAASGQQESHALFLQLAQQVEINEERIRAKINQEKGRENQGVTTDAKRR